MGTERVPAARLRKGDELVTVTGGQFRLHGVEHVGARVVRLTSEPLPYSWATEEQRRWFTVLVSTMFVRVRRDARIDMRPDLHRMGAS